MSRLLDRQDRRAGMQFFTALNNWRGAQMPDYRIYVLTKDGHLSGPAHFAVCNTDQEAIERAIPYVNSRDVEVWEGPRLVTRLKSGAK